MTQSTGLVMHGPASLCRSEPAGDCGRSSSRDPSVSRDLKGPVLPGGSNKLKVRLGIRNLAALPVMAITGRSEPLAITSALPSKPDIAETSAKPHFGYVR